MFGARAHTNRRTSEPVGGGDAREQDVGREVWNADGDKETHRKHSVVESLMCRLVGRGPFYALLVCANELDVQKDIDQMRVETHGGALTA
jgi:hypothetical protein